MRSNRGTLAHIASLLQHASGRLNALLQISERLPQFLVHLYLLMISIVQPLQQNDILNHSFLGNVEGFQVPEIVIELIDRPTETPWGAGEPSAAVIPSAISNVVFDATGVRLRSVPYTPAKVKEAMQAT